MESRIIVENTAEIFAPRKALSIMDLQDWPAAYSSDTVQKDLRDFFHAERKRLGLTQTEVANDSGGVDQGTISKIERDAPYEPSVMVFLRAIRGLGMKPSEFFQKFEQLGLTQSSVKVGQAEKTNVRLLTEEAGAHNTTSLRTQGVVDAHAATLRRSDDIDKIKFALREAGTLLLEAGVAADVDQPDSKARPRAAAAHPPRHRVRKTHTR